MRMHAPRAIMVLVMTALPACAQDPEWRAAEAPFLTDHVQITSRDMFLKAGEAYFSPDARWVIFQATPVPPGDAQPDKHYSMYIARLARDGAGRVTGIDTPLLVSPPGSYNTCGWFHPIEPGRILFGSTVVPPAAEQKAGFNVGTRSYTWLFPDETEIVTRFVPQLWQDMIESRGERPWTMELPPDATNPVPLFTRPRYDAECTWSRDGRVVLYARVRDQPTQGRPDADIWVYDTRTKTHHALVEADGYDGGPFFSPDGTRICYRSDRKLNDLLQIFVADLKLDAEGVPVGIEREHQITDNEAVNWAPYWHPNGRWLVYGSSLVSHMNYEVFATRVDQGLPAAQLESRRITHAAGADVLPVFSPDGRLMMWTAQRGPMVEGEQRPSSQLWVARVVDGFGPSESPEAPQTASP